jgi:hypothetical protein
MIDGRMVALTALREYLADPDRIHDPMVVDGEAIPGWIVVAGLDHDLKPELRVYRWQDVLVWIVRAYACMDTNGREDRYSLIAAMRDIDPEAVAPAKSL